MFNFNMGDSWSSQNSDSPLLRMGVGMDPLVGLFPKLGDWKVKTGDKLQGWVSDNIAKKDPLIKHDRKNGLASWSKEARKVSDWAQEKPLDSTALVLGGVLGGGAAMGAWGGAGGGAGAASGAGAGGLGTGGAAAAPTAAGFMPGSAAGGAAGLEGVTVLGSAGGGAAMSPGTAAAMSAAAASAGGAQPNAQKDGWNWKDMLNQQSGGGQQQQQGGGMAPQGATPGARKPGVMQRIQQGLGKMGDSLFPIDEAYGLTPAQQKQARQQAYLQMGLGMMAASSGGAGFGEAANFGMGQATQSLNGALQRGYENARTNRQEQRQKELDDRAQSQQELENDRWETSMGYRQEQDRIQNEQQQKAYDRALAGDERSESWARLRYEQDANQFERQMRMREADASREQALLGAGAVPSGYRRSADGNLEPIKGGPADPKNKTGNYQEAERNAAFLGSRLANALKTINDVKLQDPDAVKPGWAERGAQGIGMDGAANFMRSKERQQANAAQNDALDAALTLATGAAYTETQFKAARESYFPQLGDDDATILRKQQMFKDLIEFAKTKAGRAGEDIDKVLRSGAGSTGSWAIEPLEEVQ